MCSVTYTPDENWNGTINISYTITDTNDLSSTSNITVIVNPVNDPPYAESFSTEVTEDTESHTISFANHVFQLNLNHLYETSCPFELIFLQIFLDLEFSLYHP